MPLPPLIAALVAAMVLTSCKGKQSEPAAGCPDLQREAQASRDFLDANTARYRQAVARARHWLDGIDVDPVVLRAHGIKGKKKLVELLDAYARLYKIADPTEKEAIRARLQKIQEFTLQPDYHDMLKVDDLTFKEDATSYLRAAYQLDRLGFDTAFYRSEIQKVRERLDAHMTERGPHQRMAFAWYYQHFGLKEPFPLAEGFKAGVIASRPDPYHLTAVDIYALTHEVFVPYQFGDKLDADFFSGEDRTYLRWALERLTVGMMVQNNPDLVGELVSCLRYLRFTDLAVYREALEYLLSAQLLNGSWGRYEKQRQRQGDWVDQGLYLHTTMVVLEALIECFSLRDDAAAQPTPIHHLSPVD